MRMPLAARQRSPFRFNITPMIDVVFLLIIFFLVASYFIRSEQSRTVNLPTADGGQRDTEETVPHLTITLESDGQYSVAGQALSEAAILRRIQQLNQRNAGTTAGAQVRIRADRAARFSEIRRLIELCAEQKISSIRFAVMERGG